MAKSKEKKVGRPSKVEKIDPKQIENLAALMCTLDEMAAWFNVAKSTISDNFRTEIAKGRERGKTSIRKKQFDVAMNGNVTMLIWLGKQYLGQKDTQETIISEMPEIKFNVINN
jgi:hypothetical protein